MSNPCLPSFLRVFLSSSGIPFFFFCYFLLWRVSCYECYYFFLSSPILYGTAQELIWWKVNIWQCFFCSFLEFKLYLQDWTCHSLVLLIFFQNLSRCENEKKAVQISYSFFNFTITCMATKVTQVQLYISTWAITIFLGFSFSTD